MLFPDINLDYYQKFDHILKTMTMTIELHHDHGHGHDMTKPETKQ